MKYIMFLQKTGELERNIPIIFPDTLIHEEVAVAIESLIRKMGEVRLKSAGTINIYGDIAVSGKSTTLNIESNGDDARIISIYDYFHGIDC